MSKNHYFYLLKVAWRFALGHRFNLVVTYVFFVIANVILMAEPYVLAVLLNVIQEGSNSLMRDITFYLALYASLSFFFWIFHGVARVWERQIAFHVVKRFNENAFYMLLRLPLQWHKDHHSGQVMSRVHKAADALHRFVDEGYTYIITLVQFVGSFAAILYLFPSFGMWALGLGVLILVVILKFDKVLVKSLEEVNERTHRANATFYDYVSNIVTVITLRIESLAQRALVRRMMQVFPVLRKNIVVNEVKWFSVSMGLALMNFLILFFYLYERVSTGQVILIGSLTALYQYTDKFIDVFFRLAWQYEQLVWFHTDLRSVEGLEKAFAQLPERSSLSAKSSRWSGVDIRHLTFRYEDETHRVHHLKNIRLDLKPGLKIALVGESGSGKSTLLTLLRGLNQPDRVEVTDPQGRTVHSLNELANRVTLIPQNPEIFDNTIEYNVTTGLPHTRNEVLQVCEWARFTSVLKRLPKGLKTNIKEKGVNLSGGERQRLALARGLFAARHSGSDILLLDEPTSSVDTPNETAIYENLFKAFPNHCLISSLHRLYLLPRFDVIYVFDRGRLVASGTFKVLLKTSKTFQRLWAMHEESKAV